MNVIARHRARSRFCVWLAVGSLGLPALCAAQAPSSPERPWEIPQSALQRATALASQEKSTPTERPYDLVQLIDLAERTNPETRAAWEEARAAAAAIGLAEAAYLPQLSFQAIGGFEHTPLPAPKNLVPKGYFVSDTREIIPDDRAEMAAVRFRATRRCTRGCQGRLLRGERGLHRRSSVADFRGVRRHISI